MTRKNIERKSHRDLCLDSHAVSNGRVFLISAMNVHREAFRRIDALLKQTAQFGRPDVIPISDYVDAATFNFLLPGNGWTFAEWQAVNTECIRQLEARGFQVLRVPLELNDYMDFLTRYHLQNTPQNRAQYVSWKIMPDDMKPAPLKD